MPFWILEVYDLHRKHSCPEHPDWTSRCNGDNKDGSETELGSDACRHYDELPI